MLLDWDSAALCVGHVPDFMLKSPDACFATIRHGLFPLRAEVAAV